jgi:hypothetical protein
MRTRKIIRIVVGLALLFIPGLTLAATYNGQTLDGQVLPATAMSEDKTKTYDVTVMFQGTDALVTFHKGRTLTFSMETETITDPHHLRVYNYDKNTYWDIDVVGLN